jgi:hypothetical protein
MTTASIALSIADGPAARGLPGAYRARILAPDDLW